MLESAAKTKPFLPVFNFLDSRLNCVRHISCAELLNVCRTRAATFQSKFQPGEPVILFYPHGYDFIVAFYACLMAGMVPVPLAYTRRRDYQLLNELMSSMGIQALASTSHLLDNMPGRFDDPATPCLLLAALATDKPCRTGRWRRPRVSARDIAVVQLSAGASDLKCGTALSHANLLDNLARIHRAFDITASDRLLSWIPCLEGMGLIAHVLLPIYALIPSMLLEPSDFMARPEIWIEAISNLECTISGGPLHAYALSSARGITPVSGDIDLRCWRLAYVGSDNCSHEILKRFVKRYAENDFMEEKLFHYYGLCESGYFVSGRFGLRVTEINAVKYLSTGVPDASIELRLDKSRYVSPGPGGAEHGLLSISSASTGIRWQNDESSSGRSACEYALALRAAVEAGVGGVVATGDIVFMYDGELYVRAQARNVFTVGGTHFFPEDMETTLMDELSVQGLNRCVAAYLESGKRLAIAIECGRYDTAERWRGMVAAIKDMIMRKFGLLPDQVLLLRPGSLPTTGSGKVLRHACRKLLRESALVVHLLPVRGRGTPLVGNDDINRDG